MAMERIMGLPSKVPPPLQTRLRALAHDLSNSLETIMQASYLLGQKPLGIEEKKWVELIEDAAQDAAQLNRELREMLRG
jgi:K+-sensing histidine kinase KdpD